MNNFNNVFMAIKEHCSDGDTGGKDCFEQIATQAGLPLPKLDYYLVCLSELGLITYTKPGKQIMLTEQGRNTSSLFMSGNVYVSKNKS